MAAKPANAARPARSARAMVEDDEAPEKSAKRRGSAAGAYVARHRYIHVLALSAMFAAVIGAGAYATRDGLFEVMMGGTGSGTKGAGSAMARGPTCRPGLQACRTTIRLTQFHRTGVGHVLFTGPSSDNCRRMLFDNRTGATPRDGRRVSAARTPDQVDRIPERRPAERDAQALQEIATARYSP